MHKTNIDIHAAPYFPNQLLRDQTHDVDHKHDPNKKNPCVLVVQLQPNVMINLTFNCLYRWANSGTQKQQRSAS